MAATRAGAPERGTAIGDLMSVQHKRPEVEVAGAKCTSPAVQLPEPQRLRR